MEPVLSAFALLGSTVDGPAWAVFSATKPPRLTAPSTSSNDFDGAFIISSFDWIDTSEALWPFRRAVLSSFARRCKGVAGGNTPHDPLFCGDNSRSGDP